MASKALASTTLLLCLNLVFFTLVSSHYVPCPPPPQTPSGHHGGHHDGHHGGHHSGGHHGGHHGGGHHGGSGHQGGHKGGGQQGGYGGSPSQGGYGGSPSTPTTPTTPTTQGKCPIDALKLGVCANVLNDLVHLVVGNPPKTPCCPLIGGLVDLEAAVCLCTALKANILGINLNIPISLSLLLNYCGKGVPAGFQCP